MTVKDISELLQIPTDTVKSRLRLKKIKPLRYIGPVAMYSTESVELIKNAAPRGRPRKLKETDTE